MRKYYSGLTFILSLIAVLCLAPAISRAQCFPGLLAHDSDIVATPDTIVCPNNPPFEIRVNKVANFFAGCWNDSASLIFRDGKAYATPGVTTGYKYNLLTLRGNLVTNSDFETYGPPDASIGYYTVYGFTSDYLYVPYFGWGEGTYTVDGYPAKWHANFSPCYDHTFGDGSGKMMMVNGASTADVKVWSETIDIKPNTNYLFSTWLQTLNNEGNNLAKLQFSINGQAIGSEFSAPGETCSWMQFHSLWNSGNSTKAVISIINLNTQLNGNDFALDDIYFGEVDLKTETVKVMFSNPTTSSSSATVCQSSLPYKWNGTDYSAAGTYTFTTKNAAGCDSVATLVLSVNQPTTSSSSATVCQSSLPYKWNGTDYNAAGTYTFTTKNAAGCDSVATLVLSVNQPTTSSSSARVCQSSLPYKWNGTDYNAAGTYTFTTKNAAGCDSVATLVLSVNQPTTSSSSATVCQSSLPYKWNGTDYNAAGTYTFTTKNAAGCDSVATLVLSVNQPTTSSSSARVCQSSLPYKWNGTDYNAAGTYTFTTKNAAGCDSVATLVLSVNQPTTSSSSATVCQSSLPYKWNGTDYNAAGTYTFTTKNAAGCDSVATLVLSVNQPTTSSSSATVCQSSLPYKWNGTDYNAAGTYTFTTKNAAGCDSVATLVLSVNQPTTSSSSATVCQSSLPYKWNGTDYNAAGTYTFTTKNAAGCDSVATLVLSVNQPTTSSSSATVCQSSLPYKWNGTDYNAAGTYTFTTKNAAGCDSVATLVLSVNQPTTSSSSATVCQSSLPYKWNGTDYNAAGTYTFTTKNAAGCDSVATLVLSVNQPTTSSSSARVCQSSLPYKWNGTDYNAAGTYTFTTKNAAGCDSVATLVLSVNQPTTSSSSATVCQSSLPYKWNGTDYNAAGTYTFTTKNAAACDSTANLKLIISNSVSTDTTVTACKSYTWNGTTYTASGNYSKLFTTAAGCDSTANLKLIISNSVSTDTTVTACKSYTWNGTTYTASGNYSKLFTTAAGCDSTANLKLIISNSVSTDTTVTACKSYTWNGTTYTASGNYSKVFTTAAGCDSTANLKLIISNSVSTDTTVTACKSYTWNGTTYTASGNYSKLFTTAAGCDSTANLKLIISNSVSTDTTVTACKSYTWNGTTYTASGNYSKVFTTAAACDSTANLKLIISNSVSTDTTVTACKSYTWNGTTYTASGNYSKLFTTAAGCDSTANLKLIISNSVSTDTTVTACKSYTWNGTTYTASGNYSKVFTTAAACDSTANLKLIISNSVSTDTTVTACKSYTWNGTTYTASGNYSKLFTTAAACDSTANLKLIISNSVSTDTTVTACKSYTWNGTTYTASGNYSKLFTTAAGCDSTANLKLIISNSVSTDTTVTACKSYTWNGTTYTASGNYSKVFTTAAGCDSTANLKLIISNSVSTDTRVTACKSYTWNGTTYTASGNYSKVFTTAAACDSTANLKLIISNSVSTDTTVTACKSYTWNGTTYTASGNYSKLFTTAAGCDSTANLKLIISNSVSTDTTVTACKSYTWNGTTYTASGNYSKVFTTAAACDSTANLKLIISNSVSTDTTVTACKSYTWNGTTYTASGNYSKLFTTAAGCDSTANLKLIISNSVSTDTTVTACKSYTWNGTTYTASGNYSKLFTTAAGCDSTANLKLIISNSVSTDTTVTACKSYTWNGTTYTASGNYSKVFTTAAGCDSTANLKLIISNSVSTDTTVTACKSYTWNGTTYTASGNYSKLFTTAAGCDSTANLKLIISNSVSTDTTVTACKSYTWNGTTYTASGNYSKVFTTAAACDSTANLKLIISNSVSTDTTVTACKSYTWNGTTYTASGNYSKVFTTAAACDSTANLKLIISNSVSTDTTVTACKSYTWNGTTYTASGNYSKVFTTAAACDSTANLKLIISNSVSTDTTVTACKSYTWNGTTYTASGNYTKLFTTAAGCDSTANLKLIITDVAITYNVTNPTCSTPTGRIQVTSSTDGLEFSLDGGPFGAYPATGYVGVGTGKHTLAVKNAAGCTTSVEVTVAAAPGAPVAPTYSVTDPTCATSTGSINITSSTAGVEFSLDGGAFGVYPTGGYTGLASGKHTIKVKNADSCTATVNISIANAPATPPAPAATVTQQPTCSTPNGTITVTSPIGSDFSYSIDGTTYQTNTTFINVAAGTYNVTVKNTSGCISQPATVTVKSPNIVPVISRGSNAVVCAGSSYTLPWGQVVKATGTYKDTVRFVTGCDSLITTVNLTVQTTKVETITARICPDGEYIMPRGAKVSTAGVYIDTLKYSTGCDSLITTVYLTKLPTVVQTKAMYLCPGETYTMPSGFLVTQSGTYRDTIPSVLGCDSLITISNITIPALVTRNKYAAICQGDRYTLPGGKMVTTGGIYRDTVKNQSGCDSLVTKISLSVKAKPVLSVSKSNDINCSLGIATLTVSGASKYRWSSSRFISDTTISNPVVTPDVTTVYKVRGISYNGCISDDSIKVNVTKGGFSGLVPDAFTPNKDGKNDCFGVKTWGFVADLNFSIYNRWGVKMFETSDPNNCWDGTYKGVPQDEGTYVYIATGKTVCGFVNQKGTVILIR